MQTLVTRLMADFPTLRFKAGRRFSFRPPRTISYVLPTEVNATDLNRYCLNLLHELGHATLAHRTYSTDVERLKLERAAWEAARRFCAQYNIYYDEEFVEDELDSYRDWLHQRSRCPKCGLTRYQTPAGVYHCPSCAAFMRDIP